MMMMLNKEAKTLTLVQVLRMLMWDPVLKEGLSLGLDCFSSASQPTWQKTASNKIYTLRFDLGCYINHRSGSSGFVRYITVKQEL